MIHFQEAGAGRQEQLLRFRRLLEELSPPYRRGDTVGIKLHWGERGNQGFLPPSFAAESVRWLREHDIRPYVFDTTVLYSGGRRDGGESLKTAAKHGFTEEYLQCPCIVGDGLDGRDTVDIDASYRHFESVQVANLLEKSDGFFILSHLTGHMLSGFGASVKNISMGFASRAQKQRMHADARPSLVDARCTRCGICVECCPVGAATMTGEAFPSYDLNRCIGCAQCIGLCPEAALDILWNCDITDFQERLVETAAALWRLIGGKTICVNVLLSMTVQCDCMPGKNPPLAGDIGFVGGYHPVTVDAFSLERVGSAVIDAAHPGIPWRRQFSYAREIGFSEHSHYMEGTGPA